MRIGISVLQPVVVRRELARGKLVKLMDGPELPLPTIYRSPMVLGPNRENLGDVANSTTHSLVSAPRPRDRLRWAF